MKDNRFINNERGITLIALVITVIVLLILAGVAISMLSGENGILRKAAEAKIKTEEGQKQEETALASMELETYFQTENKKYKCSNGFITGITLGTKVSEFQSALPDGYTVKAEDGTDNFKKATDTGEEDGIPIVATGLAIQKDNKTVARTLIFGDVNNDGIIEASIDASLINQYLAGLNEIAYVEAADVNNDGIINYQDVDDCSLAGVKKYEIQQNRYATNRQNLKIRYLDDVKKDYIENDLPEAFKGQTKYKFEYDEEKNDYVLKGATIDEDVTGITSLFENAVIKKGMTTLTKIESGCKINITVNKDGYTTLSFEIVV